MTADHRPGTPDPRVRTILEDALAAVHDPSTWLQRDEALARDGTPVPAPWTEAHRMCASVALRRAAELRIDTDPDPGAGATWSDALRHAMTLVAATAGRLPETRPRHRPRLHRPRRPARRDPHRLQRRGDPR